MISPEVMQELLAVRQVLHYLPESQSSEQGWTPHEQQLFWVALTKYPQGPWTAVAGYIGSKTTRQAMTHAQKLRQKLKRWSTRLRSNPVVSSLMDGITVSADGNVTVSAASATPLNAASYGIPLVALISPVPSPPNSSGSIELESKDHEQHTVVYDSASYTASASGHHQPHGRTLHLPVPFIFDCRPHSQVPASTEHASSSEDHDMESMIPHDFVDELAKSVWGEDLDDDEVTEEELKELDDGDLND